MTKSNLRASSVINQFGLSGTQRQGTYSLGGGLQMSGRRSKDVSPLAVERMNSSFMQAQNNMSMTSTVRLDLESDELCPIHPGEVIIAIDEAAKDVYGCNKCVFEKRLQRPRFLVAAAKTTRKKIEL